MTNPSTTYRVLAQERCPRPACSGRDIALIPTNTHTPGP